jgi:hypothetical protein
MFIRLLIPLIFTVFLVSCKTPSNPESWMELEKNACLPTAIAFREGLRKYSVWAEVLRYSYNDPRKNGRKTGHAVVAYMYPPGKNTLWTYDYEGSCIIRAYKDKPLDIAQLSEWARGRSHITVNEASFLK